MGVDEARAGKRGRKSVILGYMLVVSVTNSGTTRLTEYQIDLLFPDAFLSQTMQYGHEVHDRRTVTHRMFRLSEQEHRNAPIFLVTPSAFSRSRILWIVL